MNIYSEAFQKYIRDRAVNYGDENIDSLVEMFFWCYWEHNPMESKRLRGLYRELDALLPEDLSGDVVNLICCIGVEHGKCAFREGFRVGGQWLLEMQKK